MFAIHHGLAVLVFRFGDFDNSPEFRALRVVGFAADCDGGPYRVASMDRVRKPKPLVTVCECAGIDLRGRQSDANSERHGAVRNGLLEWLCCAEFLIDVMRIIVSRMAGMEDDVRFRDRPAEALAFFANYIVFKILFFLHRDISDHLLVRGFLNLPENEKGHAT